MTRIRSVVWAAAVAVVLTGPGALAAGTPAQERQAIMKQTGLQMRDVSAFATGQSPWDAAKVKTLTGAIAANGKKLQGLYPTGSGADPKTEADPKIWTNKADFTKRLAEMSSLATAAGKATNAEAFKPAFLKMSATCKSCHDIYRKKKT